MSVRESPRHGAMPFGSEPPWPGRENTVRTIWPRKLGNRWLR